MKKLIYPGFAILLITIILSSCSKDDPSVTPEPSQPVFTITFMNNYISRQIPVILFLSYPDGTNYIDTTCSMNGTYTLYAPAGKPVPQTFMVTLVNPVPYWHSFDVQISTFAAVPMGSSWAVSGTGADTIGSSTVSLDQLPGNSGVILYSCAGYNDLTLHSYDRVLPLLQQPDDLYVKFETPQGEFYKYLPDQLNSGGICTIDMSDAQPASVQPVTLPFEAGNYSAILYGFKNEDYDSPSSYVSDIVLATGLPVNTMDLHYPPSRFSGFHTQMEIEQHFDSGESYLYHTEGDIPSEFRMIDATLASVQPGIANVSFSASGTFDMTSAMWEFVDYTNIIYAWKLWAPDTTRFIELPEIPPALSYLLPSLTHDSIIFSHAELTDLLTLSSYQELTEKMFSTTHPTLMDRYDASMVRKRFMPFKTVSTPQSAVGSR